MLPKRYSLENLGRVLEDPFLLVKEAKRLASKVIYPINERYFELTTAQEIDVMDEDWDNLIILDACRYDYFDKHNDIEGELRSVLSHGNYSYEFMKKNFTDEKLHDTIYITANPHATKLSDDIFYDMRLILDQYMSPEVVVQKAVEIYNSNPDKRIIVHLMPPHRPHFGPLAERFRDEFDIKDWERIDKTDTSTQKQSERPVWNLAIHGEITDEQLRDSYAETVEIALDYAKELIDKLDGKTVITSDHGELLGEPAAPLTHKRYGHPHEVNCRRLRFVPWLEVDGKERRTIVSEEPVSRTEIDDEVVDDRLEALGYKSE